MEKKENEIHRLLRLLGVNGGYLGFYYTVSAVIIAMQNIDSVYQCKWLYNEVAKLYGTTPFCVERDIRTLVDGIWNFGNRKLLKTIIPCPTGRKPNNVQFIEGLVHCLDQWEE